MEIISDAITGRDMINVVITRREITSVIPKREIMGVGKHLVWCVKMADFIYILLRKTSQVGQTVLEYGECIQTTVAGCFQGRQ